MPVPSFKEFIELPITTQHVWDSYPLVDEALVDLEQGQFMQAALLSDAVYTDDRVSAVINTRANALFGLPMSFKYQGQDEAAKKPTATPGATPPTQDDEDGPEVVELKIRVRDAVEKLWSQMFPVAALKEQSVGGWLLNAGLGELVWTWTSDGEFIPVLKTWNSQFLYWRWDTRSYWLIHQGGQTEVFPGNGRWVLFSPFGHNHGWLRGMIRSLGKLWLDRVFSQRDWARANEKYALGIMKAYEPSDGSTTDKAAFRVATRNMSSETTISLPVTDKGKFDLEMLKTDPMTGAENFERRLKNLDTCIAICVLGQNLSTEISGSSGSRAAAKVHDNVRGDYLKADAEVWSSVIATQVLSPFVRYNFEAEAKALGMDWKELVPEVTWIVDPPDDKKADSEAIANIAAAVPGLVGTEADIRALLEKYDIPVLEDRSTPDEPPPGSNVNERPLAPDGSVDGDGLPTNPDGINPPRNPNGFEPSEQPLVGASRRRLPSGLKAGARRGQAFADDLAENARRTASKALAPMREKLLTICRTADSYEEIRERVRELYLHSGKSPAQLREIVANAVVVGQLVGRLAAREDVRG